MVGTTDEEAQVADPPLPTDDEVDYLLRHVGRYFNLQVDRSDIKAVWSGLRPLVSDPDTADTAKLARDHYVELSASRLLTISGGKWTTYRKMALDAVDQAIEAFSLEAKSACRTESIPIVGGRMDEALLSEIKGWPGLASETAQHLIATYGDRAIKVVKLISNGYAAELVDGHPYIEAEVIYAIRYELAQRPLDILARRFPLALVDKKATENALDRVISLMQQELQWGDERADEERKATLDRLDSAI